MAQQKSSPSLREVRREDLDALLALEDICFSSDRLSRRRFKFWIKAEHRVFLVAEIDGVLVGYGLVLLHKGTRGARLYSLAVHPSARGHQLGRQLLEAMEKAARKAGWFYMRLEVGKNNAAAIRLYEAMGYEVFGEYHHYYEDESDALRMHKALRNTVANSTQRKIPWIRQTTNFTCGPASLLMAMCGLDSELLVSREDEFDIWREATTIFMTSGHGGTHPIGLALAAKRRGFKAQVIVNSAEPLFIDGVRIEEKRKVMALVDAQFRRQAQAEGVPIHLQELTQELIAEHFERGACVLTLVSVYRLEGRKAPHWVCVTGQDEHCLYVHDPDPIAERQDPFDCQHIPIARADFAKMSAFGSSRLRCAVVLDPPQAR